MGLYLWGCFSIIAWGEDISSKFGIYRLECPDSAAGTAFVVKIREKDTILATAAHVVCVDNDKKLLYSSGFVYTIKDNDRKELAKCKVVSIESNADIALVEATFKPDVKVMAINTAPVPSPSRSYLAPKTEFVLCGYGDGNWTETKGFLSFVSYPKLYADAIAIPGQSGGPLIFNEQIVGVCSGGSEWYYDNPQEHKKAFTWPLRAGSGKRLQEMIDSLK